MNAYSFKYRLFNKLRHWRLLKFLNLKFKNKIDGKIFNIPLLGGVGLDHFVNQESWMGDFLKLNSHLFQDKIFMDVGVNVGQTLLKLKSIAPNATYIGFEPNPHCVSYLNQLIAINQINHTSIYPVALSNTSNLSQLLFDNDGLSDSSAGIVSVYREGKVRKIDVLALAPNQYPFLQDKKIGIIKIDVEGGELEVLLGLREIIHVNQPIIIIEILPVYTIENTDRLIRQNQIQEFIDTIGYVIFRINEANAKLLEISKLEVHSDLALCNYVLKPKNSQS